MTTPTSLYWWHGLLVDEMRRLVPDGQGIDVSLLVANVKVAGGASFTVADVRRYVDELVTAGYLTVSEVGGDGRPSAVAVRPGVERPEVDR